MKIYRASCDVGYQMLKTKNDDYYEYITGGFKGEKMIDTWPTIEVKIQEHYFESDEADVVRFEFGAAFNQKSVDILKEEFKENVEVLPLRYDKYPWFAINVTTVLDCLDEEKSKLVIRAKRVFAIEKYVFKKGISYPPIFKITSFKIGIYVTEAFVKKFQENNLTGMVFDLVWDSSNEL